MNEQLNDGALEGEILCGVYRIDSKLGRGGTAWVYQATHLEQNTPLAIKVLFNIHTQDIETKQRFFREARIQTQLQHPNIIRVFDVFEEKGIIGFALEWCESGDLRHHLRNTNTPFCEENIRSLFFPILDAVDYAHSQQVIHRDLKPANVLLTYKEGKLVPKVTDFGIAKVFEEEGFTRTGSVVGTLRYIAPEQLEDSKHIDHRADIYSLGVMLYEWACGRPPFTSKSPGLMADILTKPVPFPDTAPATYQTILMDCLQKDPNQRLQSCSALKESLTRAFTDKRPDMSKTVVDKKLPSGLANPLKPLPTSQLNGHRNNRFIYVGMTLLALLLSGVLYQLYQNKNTTKLPNKSRRFTSQSRPKVMNRIPKRPTKLAIRKSPTLTRSIKRKVPISVSSINTPSPRPLQKTPRKIALRLRPQKKTKLPLEIKKPAVVKKPNTPNIAKPHNTTPSKTSFFGPFREFKASGGTLYLFDKKNANGFFRMNGERIALDKWGNVYIGFYLRGSIRFGDTILSSKGGRAIAKLSPSGRLLWHHTLERFSTFLGFHVSSNGSVWCSHYALPRAQFGRFVNEKRRQYVLFHMNANGKLLWYRVFPSKNSVDIISTMLDNNYNLFVSGRYYRQIKLGKHQAHHPRGRAFYIAKLNAQGEVLWLRTSRQKRTTIRTLAKAPKGDVYAIGTFVRTFSWNGKLQIDSEEKFKPSVFVMRLHASDGNAQWIRTFPSVQRHLYMTTSTDLSPLIHVRFRTVGVNTTSYKVAQKIIPIKKDNAPLCSN